LAKVCVFGYTHPVNDKRVFRTVESLAKKHKVFYMYRVEENKRQSEHDLQQMCPDVEFIGIPLERKDFRNPTKRLEFDRKVLQILRSVAQQVDLVYIHDWIRTHPKEPFQLIQKMGKRIIYDVHEYYPESVFENLPQFILPVKRSFLHFLINKQLSKADGLVWVSHAQKQLYKITSTVFSKVIPNVAMFSLDVLPKSQRAPALVIVGKTSRSLNGVFALMQTVRRWCSNIKLRSIGIPIRSFESCFEVYPFLPYKEMMEFLQESLYSLMIFRTYKHPSFNDVISLPNKFFDSLAAGTPVIVDEFFEEMARLTREWGVGLVVDMKDLEFAAKVVANSLKNGQYEEFLRNIKKHQEKFTWKHYESHFLEFVDRVLEEKKG